MKTYPIHPIKLMHDLEFEGSLTGSPPCNRCDSACCKVFSQVQLTEEEQANLKHENGYLLLKPNTTECHYLVKNRCSIYHKRPTACRQFDCRLVDMFHLEQTRLVDKPIPKYKYPNKQAELEHLGICLVISQFLNKDFGNSITEVFKLLQTNYSSIKSILIQARGLLT